MPALDAAPPATARDPHQQALPTLYEMLCPHLAAAIAPLETGSVVVDDMPAMAIKPRHADGIHRAISDERGKAAAHYAARFARRVWHWAARKEIVGPVNPWSGMELAGLPAKTALWTPDQIAAVVAQAEADKRPSIGLATLLAYWLAHRQADVLNLTWTALEKGIVETRKTGRSLPIDVCAYPELAAALAGMHRGSTHVVVREPAGPKAGDKPRPPAVAKPYQRHTFGHEWRAVARKAGISDDLQFRDLRSTALTEIGDAGVGIIPMNTHGGHTQVQTTRRYIRPTVDQFRTAARQRLEHRGTTKKES